MTAVVNAILLYTFLIVLFRCAGKRTLHQATVFDVVLLLIIAEAAQGVLVGEDPSLTQALVVIATLVLMDIGLSLVKQRWPGVEGWLDGRPLLILADGKPMEERMRRSRVGVDDILEAARELRGLERLEQIRYAVLERDGRISIVPRSGLTEPGLA
jgi:uncharacterized membrane protein YcaP (DUF421 family)